MKKLLLTLLCLPLIGFGQNFLATYGNSTSSDYIGSSIQQTTDGGYIIAGSELINNGGFGSNNYLLKINGSGVKEWTQVFGPFEVGYSVQQTSDGGYIISGNGPITLRKTDGNGNEQWSKDFNVKARSVQQTSDGGYIITGHKSTLNNNNPIDDVILIKTDANGDSLWTKNFGGTMDDIGYSVQQTTDGGYIIAGETMSFGNGNSDVFLLKTDGSGIAQWLQTFGGTEYDKGYSVQQTTDGGYIITGQTMSFGNGYGDVYLIKTDAIGDSLWTYTFGGPLSDAGYSVQQTTDGGYIITGYKGDAQASLDKDILLLKVNGSGVYEWDRLSLGTMEDIGYSVQQTTDGGYVIAGSTELSTKKIIVLKVDANGFMSSSSLEEHTSNKQLLKVTDLLGRKTKQTNQPLFYIYDDGTVEKRITID